MMKKIEIEKYKRGAFLLLLILGLLCTACEKFFYPEQGLIVQSDIYYQDWSEYRAAELGLDSLQQQLVDQIVILGELRADLLEVTENADRDLIEIQNLESQSGQQVCFTHWLLPPDLKLQ